MCFIPIIYTALQRSIKTFNIPVMLKKIWIFWSLVGPVIFRCLLLRWWGCTRPSCCRLASCRLPVAKPDSK